MIAIVSGEDVPYCVRWEILMHERFSGVWICKDSGRATTGRLPPSWAGLFSPRTSLAATAGVKRSVLSSALMTAASPSRGGGGVLAHRGTCCSALERRAAARDGG